MNNLSNDRALFQTFPNANACVFAKVKHFLTILFFSSFYLFNLTSISSISLLVLLMLIFISAMLENGFKIRLLPSKFLFLSITFSLYCFLSSMWAFKNSMSSVEKGLTILEIAVCMYVVSICYGNEKSAINMVKTVMWSGVLVSLYILVSGFSSVFSAITSGSRLALEFANTNAVGMLMALSIPIFAFFILFKKFKAYHLFAFFPLIVLAATQSRTAVIELIFGLICIFLYWLFKKNNVSILNKIIFTIVLFSLTTLTLSGTSFFSGSLKRIQSMLGLFDGSYNSDGSSRIRMQMIEYGLQLFRNNPTFGIGIGNAGIGYTGYTHDTYLHNNYVELLANGGLVGTFLFYIIHVTIAFFLIHKKGLKKPSNFLFITLLFMILVADLGTVSYYSKWTYYLLMISFEHIRKDKTIL